LNFINAVANGRRLGRAAVHGAGRTRLGAGAGAAGVRGDVGVGRAGRQGLGRGARSAWAARSAAGQGQGAARVLGTTRSVCARGREKRGRGEMRGERDS
jgi:hypothetical protein